MEFGWLSLSPSTYLAIGVLLATLIYIKKYIVGPSNIPPGPMRIPIVGSTIFMREHPPNEIAALSQTYGDVMSVQVGRELWVILNSPAVVREAFKTKADRLSGRQLGPFNDPAGDRWGMSIIDADFAFEHKQFALQVLKDFGMGRSVMEDNINTAVDRWLDRLRLTEGRPLDPVDDVELAIAEVIGDIISRPHHDKDGAELRQILASMRAKFESYSIAPTSWLEAVPVLRYLAGGETMYEKMTRDNTQQTQFAMKLIELHNKDELSEGEDVRDFIDAFQRRTKQLGPEAEAKKFSVGQLVAMVLELYGGAVHTTVTAISWQILHLALYADVQQTIYDEVLEVFESQPRPDARGRSSCHYTEAFILEVLRNSFVLFGQPHRATDDVTIAGHLVPKDSTVAANFWAIHHDRRYWKDPEKFQPERFLDNNGELNHKGDVFMPFSTGRRMCLGESLAKMEMFLFVTNLVRHYKIELPPGTRRPDMTGRCSVVLLPPEFKVVLTPRD